MPQIIILFCLPPSSFQILAKAKKESNPSPKPETATAAAPTLAAPIEQPAAASARKETPSPAIASTAATAAVVNEVPIQKDSPKSLASKERLNKKKKNELIIQSRQMSTIYDFITEFFPDKKLHIFSTQSADLDQMDDMSVNTIMSLLGKAELTRSEIQILIDYLLNKQQDNTSNHSEWSDDIVQKLKRQLADKEKILAEEQESSAGFQVKLREMRAEINTERVQNQYKMNAFVEELNAKKMETQNLSQEIQFINDKYSNEKQALANQLQQLQTKLYLDKQLSETNTVLTNENFSKNHIINDLQEKLNHATQTITDLEQKLRDYDMVLRQGESEMGVLKNEMQRLHGDNVQNVADKEEYEKMLSMQKFDLEQLRAQVAEQTAKSSHLDDSSKVEIRNLQNALDSSNTELQLGRADLANSKERVDELTAKVRDLDESCQKFSNNYRQHEKQVNATFSIWNCICFVCQ